MACSGATVGNDYTGDEINYKGQDARLKNLPAAKRVEMKEDALEVSFIPGRTKQIAFVAKYQPKVVTITGGGNDVGFAGIISACALPLTCPDATDESKISTLGAKIQAQYLKLVSLYYSIHEASPRTKIYAINYPQFTSSKDDPCPLNVGLNKTEREFIREGVTMMNKVIKAAADTAGVEYIDIESALGDHVLCGTVNPSLWYVTGITKNDHWTKDNGLGFFSPGSFHPNAKGHIAMANAIKMALNDKSLADYSYCEGSATMCPKMTTVPEVSLTSFFSHYGSEVKKTTRETFAPQFVQPKVDPKIKIHTDAPKNSKVVIRMESTPRTLAEVDVGDDGILDTEVTIPVDVEAGFHTLYIDTLSPSGEPITLWQHITVQGRSGDLDDNGIEDTLQPCPFITGTIQDTDVDGIDDRCDSEIGYIDNKEERITSSLRSDVAHQTRPNTLATTGAKDLLKSESQLVAQHFSRSDGTLESASHLPQAVQNQYSVSSTDVSARNKIDTSRRARTGWINIFGITILATMCILIAGLLYARIHSKKP